MSDKTKIESVKRETPIDPQALGAGKCLVQFAWRDQAGELYCIQKVGDGAVLCVDMALRSNLVWSAVAAWISTMAATLGIEVAEIETDPKAPRSGLVGPTGKPVN